MKRWPYMFILAVSAGCQGQGESDCDGTSCEGDSGEAEAALVSSYSGTYAASYASSYYNNPNANFTDYTALGGDCTNFASQSILAGLAMSTSKSTVFSARLNYQDKAYASNDWWYTSDADRAKPEWAGANGLFTYLKNQASNPGWKGIKTSWISGDNACPAPTAFKKGDIVSLVNKSDSTIAGWAPYGNAYHTMVVVQEGTTVDTVWVAFRNASGYSAQKKSIATYATNGKIAMHIFHITGFEK